MPLPEEHFQSPDHEAKHGPKGINPQALSVDEMARLLSAAGNKRIAPEQIRADIDAGAPVNPNGTMNLVHYAAWLIREVQTGGD